MQIFIRASCIALIAAAWTPASFCQNAGGGATPPAPAKVCSSLEECAAAIAQDIVSRSKTRTDSERVLEDEEQNLITSTVPASFSPNNADVKEMFQATVETSRTDKQIGAPSSAPGTTSTAEHPGFAQLLGIAIENGAVSQAVNGTTLTLSSTPYAVITALQGKDTDDTYKRYGFYTRFGLSANFNIAQQNDPLASVTRKQLNEWSGRVRLFGDHSSRSQAALGVFQKSSIQNALQALATDASNAMQTLLTQRTKVLRALEDTTEEEIKSTLVTGKAANTSDSDLQAKITNIIVTHFAGFLAAQDANFTELQRRASEKYQSDVRAYLSSRKAFEDALAALQARPEATLIYMQERPQAGSSYSVVKLAYQQSTRPTITANASGSFYSTPDASKNQETFRDFSCSFELQGQLARSPVAGSLDQSQVTLSLSGQYERFPENRDIAGKKPDLAAFTAKLELPLKAGISLPLSFTYATATELNKEDHVRGNFGLSFDLDKLYSLLSAR